VSNPAVWAPPAAVTITVRYWNCRCITWAAGDTPAPEPVQGEVCKRCGYAGIWVTAADKITIPPYGG
jgi:hypothetical protein